MSILLFEYDNRYEPPAPVATIRLVGVGSRVQTVQVQALLDSGADATMIPESILRQIGAMLQDTAQMRGVNDVVRRVKLYDVLVEVANQRMRILAVAMPPHSTVIVGRDVLNRLKVTLDGFSSYTTIETLFDD